MGSGSNAKDISDLTECMVEYRSYALVNLA